MPYYSRAYMWHIGTIIALKIYLDCIINRQANAIGWPCYTKTYTCYGLSMKKPGCPGFIFWHKICRYCLWIDKTRFLCLSLGIDFLYQFKPCPIERFRSCRCGFMVRQQIKEAVAFGRDVLSVIFAGVVHDMPPVRLLFYAPGYLKTCPRLYYAARYSSFIID